jgi:hemoglobin
MRDIAGRADLDELLTAFYSQALADPVLRPVFVDEMRLDLREHLPVIAAFWEQVLFRTGEYSGQTMDVHRRVHQRIPLTSTHFDRWLELFQASVDRLFTGPVTDQAKAHAARMAAVFLRNLAAPPNPRSLPLVPARPALHDRLHRSASRGAASPHATARTTGRSHHAQVLPHRPVPRAARTGEDVVERP